MSRLLDANVLIASTDTDHVHHGLAASRIDGSAPFATCPMTQGALLRHLLRTDHPARDAWAVLAAITALEGHRFWPDVVAYDDVPGSDLTGHRQVTDAYLAQLARHHGGRLLTLDRGLVATHPDVADLLG